MTSALSLLCVIFISSCGVINGEEIVGHYDFSLEIKDNGDYISALNDGENAVINKGRWKKSKDQKHIYFTGWKFLDSSFTKPLCNCIDYNAYLYKNYSGELQIDFYPEDDSYSFKKIE